MIHYMIEIITRAKENERLRDACAKLLSERDQMLHRRAQDRLTIATLQAENRLLRRRLGDRDMRAVRRAQHDALLIGGLYFAGLPTSRRACGEVGLTEWRWMRAQALLRVGRVANDGRIRVECPDDYERGVRVAVERIAREGIDSLNMRMPVCRQ